MAILNLAGNFQPSSVVIGSELPRQSTGRASSASKNTAQNEITAVVPQINELDTKNTDKVDSLKSQPANANQQDTKSQIEELQQFNQNIDRSLQFQVDDDLGITVVRVIDKETDELIRQFPPEELINLSRRLKELNEQNSISSGVLLQEKV
jgi:flagellar protein FlaG